MDKKVMSDDELEYVSGGSINHGPEYYDDEPSCDNYNGPVACNRAFSSRNFDCCAYCKHKND